MRYPCVALTKSPLYCCAGVDGIRQVSGRDKAARLDEVQGHQLLLAVDNGWTRGLHWLYLVVDIYVTWWNDERTFMVVGAVPILLFSCFNIFLLVIPAWKRFLKVRSCLGLHLSFLQARIYSHDFAPRCSSCARAPSSRRCRRTRQVRTGARASWP